MVYAPVRAKWMALRASDTRPARIEPEGENHRTSSAPIPSFAAHFLKCAVWLLCPTHEVHFMT